MSMIKDGPLCKQFFKLGLFVEREEQSRHNDVVEDDLRTPW